MFINSAISRRNALTGSIMLIAALGLMFTLPFQVEAASPCPAVNDWCTTMTVADAEGDGLLHGYEFDKFGSIVDDTIQPGGANINVWTVHTFAHPLPQLPDYIYFGSIPRVPRGTQVTIEGHTFIADAESDDGQVGDRWDVPSGELPASLVWSAGQEVTVSVKLASPCDNLDNLVNAIVVKNLTGEITQAGDTNLHKIRLDPYKSYLIEAIGVDGSDMLGVEEHPNLTLEDPEIPAIWNARGRSELITYGSKSDGNAIRRILRTDHRTYKIEVSSGNNGTGTYQLKVRVNNICRINDDGDAQYQWAGGPEGYPQGSDLPAGIGGRQVLLTGTDWGNNNVTRPEIHHVLGDNRDSNPDEDWIGVDLEQGEEYTVRLRTKTSLPERLQATQLKILGIKDADGNADQRHRQRGRRRKDGLRRRLGGAQHRPLLHRRGDGGHRPDRDLLDQHHQEVPGLTGPRLKKTKLMWASMRGRTSGRARPSRVFSAARIAITWRRRPSMAPRTWVSASRSGRSGGADRLP